jgi:hypothetical protein
MGIQRQLNLASNKIGRKKTAPISIISTNVLYHFVCSQGVQEPHFGNSQLPIMTYYLQLPLTENHHLCSIR